MPDKKQLPSLIKLVDDESKKVNQAVLRELAAFGPSLEQYLRELPALVNESQIDAINEKVKSYQRKVNNLIDSISKAKTNKITASFQPGELVKHRRYGYRGVVVDFDRSCQASNTWHQSNQTQPDRDQPWYHVLVHNSTSITYAAQTSLIADDSEEEINHPLVFYFFSKFENGIYLRNNEPWPEVE